MTKLTMAMGMAAIMLSSGAAYAQDSMASKDGMMSKGGMMSKHDTMMMKKCQGMDHDMMMKNKSCKKMMKMHPDMMNSGMMQH